MKSALAVLLLLSACARAPAFLPEPADVQSDGPYRHEPSGMVFPTEAAGFNRTRVAHFAADGSDAAVAYDLVTGKGDVAATVYLHRAAKLLTVGLAPDAAAAEQERVCRGELSRRTAEMLRTHLDPSPPRTHAISVVTGGASREGVLVQSTYAADLANGGRRVRTELALFCRAGASWTLEFRYSFDDAMQADDRNAALMGALDWSGLE